MSKTKMTISGPGVDTVETTMEDLQERMQEITNALQHPTIRIKSGQLKDEYCNYSYEHKVALGVVNKYAVKSQVKFHPDLKAAFDKFNAHLAVICEEVSPKDIRDIDRGEGTKQAITDKLEAFTVDAFQLCGDAIILIGQKLLTTGESVKLETPEIELEGSYEFSDELYNATLDLLDEILAYHAGEKKAPDPQQEIQFEPEIAD